MDTIELMLALIRGSLNRRVPDLPQISYKEWEDLYWLSRKHGVVTIINDAIEMLPAEQQPQGDIAISWTLSAERTRFHFNHQAEVLNTITAKADEEGLRWILIKGMSLARLYPVPSSRACGDIDICFPNNYEKGNVLLGNPNATMDGKHAEIVIDGGIPCVTSQQSINYPCAIFLIGECFLRQTSIFSTLSSVIR